MLLLYLAVQVGLFTFLIEHIIRHIPLSLEFGTGYSGDEGEGNTTFVDPGASILLAFLFFPPEPH